MLSNRRVEILSMISGSQFDDVTNNITKKVFENTFVSNRSGNMAVAITRQVYRMNDEDGE
jgi:hypothetical protein